MKLIEAGARKQCLKMDVWLVTQVVEGSGGMNDCSRDSRTRLTLYFIFSEAHGIIPWYSETIELTDS